MINVYWYKVQVFSIYKFVDMLSNEIALMLQVEKNRHTCGNMGRIFESDSH